MPIFKEGALQFEFSDQTIVERYDEWSSYKENLTNVCGGLKAVDFICLLENTCWLLEIKDYRLHPRKKSIELAHEIAFKVRDTLAGLVIIKLYPKADPQQKEFAAKVFQQERIRVVFHLEQPAVLSKIESERISVSQLKFKLRHLLKPVDADPIIVNQQSITPSIPWIVKSTL